MKRDQIEAAPPERSVTRPETFPRLLLRLLLRRPAELASPALGAAASLLAIAGAALAIWSDVLHLQLWSEGYRDIAVIGPLFLVQGASGIVLALFIALFRRLALIAAGAVELAATAGGLLLSVSYGLFGFKESLAVPYATESLVVEFTGAAILVVAAVLLLAAPVKRTP